MTQRRFRSRDGIEYLTAFYEGEYVRVQSDLTPDDHDVETIEDFEKMMEDGGWTEEDSGGGS